MYLTIRKPILVRKIRKSESDAHLRVDGGVAVGTIRVVEKPAPVATGAMMSTALAWEMKCGGRAVMNEQSEDDSLERAPDD